MLSDSSFPSYGWIPPLKVARPIDFSLLSCTFLVLANLLQPYQYSINKACIQHGNLSLKYKLFVTVQDGGKTGAKTGVKLAYKHDFAPVFTSEEPPMFLE